MKNISSSSEFFLSLFSSFFISSVRFFLSLFDQNGGGQGQDGGRQQRLPSSCDSAGRARDDTGKAKEEKAAPVASFDGRCQRFQCERERETLRLSLLFRASENLAHSLRAIKSPELTL
jgi:hypothetical protein